MTGSMTPTCVGCGADLVLEMDPAAPPDAQAQVLLADPPYRLVCTNPRCSRPGTVI